MTQNIDEYLNSLADSYKPKKSKDPMENECSSCTFTEQAHIVGLKFTCDKFSEVKE